MDTQLHIKTTPEFKKSLKEFALMNDKTMTQVVHLALINYLGDLKAERANN